MKKARIRRSPWMKIRPGSTWFTDVQNTCSVCPSGLEELRRWTGWWEPFDKNKVSIRVEFQEDPTGETLFDCHTMTVNVQPADNSSSFFKAVDVGLLNALFEKGDRAAHRGHLWVTFRGEW